MCGVGALAMLSGGVCSLRPAVYEATEGAIFRVSLAHRGSPAVAAHALARGCGRCAWSLRCVGGLAGCFDAFTGAARPRASLLLRRIR